jgi:hypothetical protein
MSQAFAFTQQFVLVKNRASVKKLGLLLGTILVSTISYGQGELFFATRNVGIGLNAPYVLVPDGTRGPGPAFSAQLGLWENNRFTAVPSSLTTFQEPGPGAAAIVERYVVPVTVVFPDHAPGSAVTLRMRLWLTSSGSFENAKDMGWYFAESGDIAVTLGGGIFPPADLPTSFTGFTVLIPEPSTISLVVFAGALLLLYRRK